jgi:hypothetical protein
VKDFFAPLNNLTAGGLIVLLFFGAAALLLAVGEGVWGHPASLLGLVCGAIGIVSGVFIVVIKLTSEYYGAIMSDQERNHKQIVESKDEHYKRMLAESDTRSKSTTEANIRLNDAVSGSGETEASSSPSRSNYIPFDPGF